MVCRHTVWIGVWVKTPASSMASGKRMMVKIVRISMRGMGNHVCMLRMLMRMNLDLCCPFAFAFSHLFVRFFLRLAPLLP